MDKEELKKKVDGVIDWVQTMFVRDGTIYPRYMVITKLGHTTVFDLAYLSRLNRDVGSLTRSLISLLRSIRSQLAATIFIAEAGRVKMPVGELNREEMLQRIRNGATEDLPHQDCLITLVELNDGADEYTTKLYMWPIVSADNEIRSLGKLEYTDSNAYDTNQGSTHGMFYEAHDLDMSMKMQRSAINNDAALNPERVSMLRLGVSTMMLREAGVPLSDLSLLGRH